MKKICFVWAAVVLTGCSTMPRVTADVVEQLPSQPMEKVAVYNTDESVPKGALLSQERSHDGQNQGQGGDHDEHDAHGRGDRVERVYAGPGGFGRVRDDAEHAYDGQHESVDQIVEVLLEKCHDGISLKKVLF